MRLPLLATIAAITLAANSESLRQAGHPGFQPK
jgi:hypothetical protein